MFSYLAWVWSADEKGSALEAAAFARRMALEPAWSCAFKKPGVEVYVTGCRPRSSEVYTLEEGAGVILGKLFVRTEGRSHTVPVKIPRESTRRIMARGGRDLIAPYWGRYVAFLYDAVDHGAIRVLRGPSGSLPCLGVQSGGLQVYCSWIPDMDLLGLQSWSINWPVVCALLCDAPPDIRQTGLKELSQVLGGECITHRGQHSERAFYWDPIRTAVAVPDDMAGAADVLRATLIDSVQAWASCYDSIVQTLSGGLDSSIVASILSRSSPRPTTFLNYFFPESDSDEREFARLMAGHLGAELLEWERDPSLDLKGLLQMHRMPVPTVCLHSLEFSHREADLCAQREATAIFNGFGGDQAFYTGRGAPCAVSYAKKHGLCPEMFGVTLDAAYRDRVSVWHVVREVFQQLRRPGGRPVGLQIGKFRTLVEADVVEYVQRLQPAFIHPLLRDYVGVDPARLLHAEQLLPSYDFYDYFCTPNDPERVAPILSQPVVELCLNFPRDLLIRGGWNRAVARRAFLNSLPCEIVMRPGKGGVSDQVRSVLRRNRGFVAELLLDGELTKRHIINKTRLETALARNPTQGQTGDTELAVLICAAGWLSRFQSHM